ncbi:MAG: hypothetical protein GW936_05705 [Gallionella sp.]|nr:hypothetical protein [Gallionella sp.]
MKRTYCLEVRGNFACFTFPEPKIVHNAPCPCGSGKKYKKFCMAENE